jgi:hypothetical protein
MYVIFFYSIYVLPLPYIQGVWQSNATFSLPLYFKNPSHGLYIYQVGTIPSLRRDETRFFYPLSKKNHVYQSSGSFQNSSSFGTSSKVASLVELKPFRKTFNKMAFPIF